MTLSNFIEGLQIIARHEKDGHCLRAEHDQFWVSSCDLPLTSEETKMLLELGWFMDEDANGWSVYT